jgi:hypothetical protein
LSEIAAVPAGTTFDPASWRDQAPASFGSELREIRPVNAILRSDFACTGARHFPSSRTPEIDAGLKGVCE